MASTLSNNRFVPQLLNDDPLIEEAIAATTGPGDTRPYVYRVCSYLVARLHYWTMNDFDTVQMYLVARRADRIPLNSFYNPNTGNRKTRRYNQHGN